MSDLDVLALNDFDRAFFKAAGIEIPDESPWEIEAESDVCAEAEAARWLWDAWANREAAQ
jgi:hypothetical protein